jgi:CRP-like cAMP-binding protein
MTSDNPAHQILTESFKNLFPLTKEERVQLISVFKERKIRRKLFILQEGDVCKHFTFIVSGCFRQFAVDQSGKEFVLQFAAEKDWITDLSSFYNETASNTYIQALEPATILQINNEDLLHLYMNYPKFDRNFRIIFERKYMELQHRILQNISVTAEERYLSFIAQFPDIALRLPNTQIASYLGITPEFLSRIRKDQVSKK